MNTNKVFSEVAENSANNPKVNGIFFDNCSKE